VAELSGRTVTYGYDDLYRLTSENVSGDPGGKNGAVSYTFDSVGNRMQRNSTLPAVVATGLLNYDANDRTATDPYDANGNPLQSGAGANVYDFENRLVQAGGVSLVYDGDGNRVQETVAGVTTTYLVADQNLTGYAQVMDELQGGAVTRTYTYGLSLISERQTLAAVPVTSFYGFDGHGSVRYLTSSTGAVTDTYDYDAFGNLISSTGTTPNNYLFAGEQFDPVLGIYYNRARYYDQRQGRFWSMDEFEGPLNNPFALHRYLYASEDPVNRLDPSGRDDIAEFSVANSIATTLNNITSIQGQAVMDQIKYGGNAGLKSLFITGAIVGGAIAISALGRIVRQVPLLKSGAPARVVVNALSPEETAFAEEIVSFRGGEFVGQVKAGTAGIDGFLEGIPASLKVLETSRVENMVDQLFRARGQLASANYFGAEIFVSAKNITSSAVLNTPGILQDIEGVARSGFAQAVNILTQQGWIRIQ
jgi:RHS repeat-associated protein